MTTKAQRRFERRHAERKANENKVHKQVFLDWLREWAAAARKDKDFALEAHIEGLIEHFCEDFDYRDTLFVDSAAKLLTANRDGLVSHHHGSTGRAAAKLITLRSGTLRYRVLELIAQNGLRGMTRDEIAEQGCLSPNTVRPRVRELFEGDFITLKLDDRGEVVTRKTPQGRDAEVIEVTRKGHAALRAGES